MPRESFYPSGLFIIIKKKNYTSVLKPEKVLRFMLKGTTFIISKTL
jgi:hypothetical protein